MDLIERIEELQVLVEEAKAVPLSSSAVINREEFLDLLGQLKDEVPDEIRQARWMAKDREELLARARKEAERIIAEAREQRDRLLSRTEIVHAAQREADRITDEAKEKATKLQIEAEDYIDQKLAAFEILLDKTMKTVGKGREQLRGTRSTGSVPDDLSGAAGTPATQTAPFDADAFSQQPL
jgi:cell division septum initiation protein DivIVA